MTIDTVLFDLDGTLLPLDMDEFLNNYFKLLTQDFTDIAEPKVFTKHLYQATMAMINNNGEKYNSQVFEESFFSLIEVENREEIMNRFEIFYQNKFPLLREGQQVDGKSAEMLTLLKENGFQLVLATNAVFPLVAIVERLRWARINPANFSFITSYENMHYCKPDLGYYQEIIKKMKIDPRQCMMIGNDLQEDMIAGELGIETYLVEDFLIDREESKKEIKPDWSGSFDELLVYFKENIISLD